MNQQNLLRGIFLVIAVASVFLLTRTGSDGDHEETTAEIGQDEMASVDDSVTGETLDQELSVLDVETPESPESTPSTTQLDVTQPEVVSTTSTLPVTSAKPDTLVVSEGGTTKKSSKPTSPSSASSATTGTNASNAPQGGAQAIDATQGTSDSKAGSVGTAPTGTKATGTTKAPKTTKATGTTKAPETTTSPTADGTKGSTIPPAGPVGSEGTSPSGQPGTGSGPDESTPSTTSPPPSGEAKPVQQQPVGNESDAGKISAGQIKPVSYWKSKFDSSFDEAGDCQKYINDIDTDWGSHALYRSAYTCFDGLVAMWRATGDLKYLETSLRHVEGAIAKAEPSSQIAESKYKDSFLGWPGKASTYNGNEISLTEAFFFRYVTIMLREMKETPSVMANSGYAARYASILSFTETNIYGKWKDRHEYREMFRSKTHMASHWAHICMNLAQISTNQEIVKDCKYIVDQITNGIDHYGGAGLVSQLVPLPGVEGAVYWANDWGVEPSETQPADTSHGSAEVGFLVEGYDYGYVGHSTLGGIAGLVHSSILPTGNEKAPAWIAGAGYSCPEVYKRTSNCPTNGNLFTDGFVKLGRHDVAIQRKLEVYVESQSYNRQLLGNAALNASILLAG